MLNKTEIEFVREMLCDVIMGRVDPKSFKEFSELTDKEARLKISNWKGLKLDRIDRQIQHIDEQKIKLNKELVKFK